MKKLKRPVAILLTIVMVISMMNLTVFAEEDDQSPVVNADGLAGTEESVPVCGLEESQGHVHDETCYTTEQVLTCGIPENHVHTVDCYQLGDPDFGKGTGMEIDGQWYLVDHIICEIPEGHVHTDVCYEEQQVLICGLEESEGHTHTAECYTVPEITEAVEPEIFEPAPVPEPTEPPFPVELPQNGAGNGNGNGNNKPERPETPDAGVPAGATKIELVKNAETTNGHVWVDGVYVDSDGNVYLIFDSNHDNPQAESGKIGNVEFYFPSKATYPRTVNIGPYLNELVDGQLAFEQATGGKGWTFSSGVTLKIPEAATSYQLTITKVWSGLPNDVMKPNIGFTAQLGNLTITAQKSEEGKYTVDTKIPGTYTITESGAAVDGYTLKTTGDGTVTVDSQNATTTVTNTYEEEQPKTGSLTITKTVVGGPDEASSTKKYKFTVTGPSYTDEHEVIITGANYTTLENLVPGTYSVTEQEANIEGYSLEVTGGGTVTATVEAETTTTATITNTYTKLLPELEVSKNADKDNVQPDDTVIFTITVRNTGEVDATNVVVTDTMPTGLTYGTSLPGGSTMDGRTVTFNLGTLAANEAKTIKVVATVDDGATGELINTATAQCDEVEESVQARATVVIVDPNTPTKNVTVTIRKIVVGEGAPEDDVFTFHYDAYTVGANGNVINKSDNFTLKNGESKSITDVAEGYPITITETLTEAQQDRYQEPATVQKVVHCGNPITITNYYLKPELNISKTASKSTVNPGEAVNFTITVTNTGTGTAHNVVITDKLPEGFTQMLGKTDFEWQVGNLKPGEAKTVTISQVYASKTGSNTATAKCDENENGV